MYTNWKKEMLEDDKVIFVGTYISEKQVQTMIQIIQPYLKKITGYDRIWIDLCYSRNPYKTWYEIKAKDKGKEKVFTIANAKTPKQAFNQKFGTLLGRKISDLLYGD